MPLGDEGPPPRKESTVEQRTHAVVSFYAFQRDVHGVGVHDRWVRPGLFDLLQLGKHTDRVLPDGYCMLPPRQACDRGNACHGCGNFATDRTFLPQLERQLHETRVLITGRRAQHHQHTGTPMADTNVWLQSRLDEARKLETIITSLNQLPHDDHRPVQSPGVAARDQ